MVRWSVEQALAAAPDDSSRKSARGLTAPRNWSGLGSTDDLVWGKCQGSGKEPYQVSVDLNGPAFRCTCPSRKFPCKHGVALLLMWAANDGSVTDVQQPEAFATEWAADRRAKDEAKQEKVAKKAERTDDERAADAASRAKREEKRIALMTVGLDEFDRWLADLVRGGFASARTQPYSFWDQAAARLVDSQVPGLADAVRALPSDVLTRADWVDALLRATSRLAVLSAAWRNRAALDDEALAELRRSLGWAIATDDVVAGRVETDRWIVLGSRSEGDERLMSLRTWLRGEATGRTVVVFDFSGRGGQVPVGHVAGTCLEGAVALYPGGSPQRALITTAVSTHLACALPLGDGIDAAVAHIARTLAENPLARSVPVLLGDVRIVEKSGTWYAARSDGAALPIAPSFKSWLALAHIGDEPCTLFGEWVYDGLLPLSLSSPTTEVRSVVSL
jgi:hypothetical protein